jgi:hypothetical protein
MLKAYTRVTREVLLRVMDDDPMQSFIWKRTYPEDCGIVVQITIERSGDR